MRGRLWLLVTVLGGALSSWSRAQAAAGDAMAAMPADALTPVRFEFRLRRPAPLTSAGVFDAQGRKVRTLWALMPMPAGEQEAAWDGLDDYGQPAPPGAYQARVVVNEATYEHVNIVGNTGRPADEFGHIQHGVLGVATDLAGRIYTANGWEEGGHDFKVFDPAGHTLFHARYQIRNGNPNGAPHAIAVDQTHLYCATHGWENETWKHKMQIQRFRVTDGTLEPFTDAALAPLAGHIELYEWPKRQIPAGTPPADAELMALPVRALAVGGDTLFATDALGGKVHRFHKVTGTKQGEFAVRLPAALALDAAGRLWVAHEHGQISLFMPDGTALGTPLADQGEIRSLAFGPDGHLYVADGRACEVRIFDVTGARPQLRRTFGAKAAPGDAAPDRFYALQGAAVDGTGHLVTIASLPTGGARIARFAPDGASLWEHLGLMFCDVGTYAPWRPDELLTERFHRLSLGDRTRGEWRYAGTVLDGDPRYINAQHGNQRFLRLGDAEFMAQCYGDGVQFYRRTPAGLYRLAAMVGGGNPWPDGTWNDRLPPEARRPLRLWSWADANADARPDPAEIAWYGDPDQARYAVFGVNVDERGSLLYAEHHTRAVWELPLTGTSPAGNPLYDWRQARQVVPPDASPLKLLPLMAVRAGDGSLYAFGRTELWERPDGKEGGYAWMGGWALVHHAADGQRLWAAKLPGVCVGMAPIPARTGGGDGGVMIGYFKDAHVYHFTPDGLLVGRLKPGEPGGNVTGWMDNTAAVAVSRDPRDGWLDVFGEDSWLNRMMWYRVNDTGLGSIVVKLKKE